MLRYLLDTDLCIRVIRDRPAGLRPRFNAESSGLCISDVVLYDLLYGAKKSAKPAESRQAVERLAGRLSILPVTATPRPIRRTSGPILSVVVFRSAHTTS